MARGIERTELLELLAETVNNENPMLPGAETIKKHSPHPKYSIILALADQRKNI